MSELKSWFTFFNRWTSPILIPALFMLHTFAPTTIYEEKMEAMRDNQNTMTSHYTKLSLGSNLRSPQTASLQGHEEKDQQSLRLRVFHKTDWFLEVASAVFALLALLGIVCYVPLILAPYIRGSEPCFLKRAFVYIMLPKANSSQGHPSLPHSE